MPRITHRADLMHNSYASNLGLAITSNYVLTADGQGGLSWAAGGTLSYASNSNDVSAVGAAGASTLVPRADHVHRSPLYFVNSTTARLVTNTIHQASTATTGTLTLNSGTADLLADSGSGLYSELYLSQGLIEMYADGYILLEPNNGAAGGGNTDKVKITGGHGLVLPVLTADPAAGASEEGQMYRNSTAGTVKVYLGGSWRTITTS